MGNKLVSLAEGKKIQWNSGRGRKRGKKEGVSEDMPGIKAYFIIWRGDFFRKEGSTSQLCNEENEKLFDVSYNIIAGTEAEAIKARPVRRSGLYWTSSLI